jgi:hypothetical protein
MTIELTDDERSLAAYALRELTIRRLEQAIDARSHGRHEMAKGLLKDARRCEALDLKLMQS